MMTVKMMMMTTMMMTMMMKQLKLLQKGVEMQENDRLIIDKSRHDQPREITVIY